MQTTRLMPKRPALFADTVVLSNFSLSGRFDLFLARYSKRLCSTPQVLEELLAGVQAGHGALEEVVRQFRSSVIRTVAVPLDQLTVYQDLRRTLGAGEASSIVMAWAGGGIVATDDMSARQACARLAVKVTGTIGILLAAVRDGEIAPPEAEQALADMVEHGFYSPVRRLADELNATPPP